MVGLIALLATYFKNSDRILQVLGCPSGRLEFKLDMDLNFKLFMAATCSVSTAGVKDFYSLQLLDKYISILPEHLKHFGFWPLNKTSAQQTTGQELQAVKKEGQEDI